MIYGTYFVLRTQVERQQKRNYSLHNQTISLNQHGRFFSMKPICYVEYCWAWFRLCLSNLDLKVGDAYTRWKSYYEFPLFSLAWKWISSFDANWIIVPSLGPIANAIIYVRLMRRLRWKGISQNKIRTAF